jgi:hypothetical protein
MSEDYRFNNALSLSEQEQKLKYGCPYAADFRMPLVLE